MPYYSSEGRAVAQVDTGAIPMNDKFMPWIDELPNVDSAVVARRDVIAAKLRQADALMQKVERLRIEAMRESSELEASTKQRWSFNEIDLAKFRAGC